MTVDRTVSTTHRCECGKCGKVVYVTVYGRRYYEREMHPSNWRIIVPRWSLKKEFRCDQCDDERKAVT